MAADFASHATHTLESCNINLYAYILYIIDYNCMPMCMYHYIHTHVYIYIYYCYYYCYYCCCYFCYYHHYYIISITIIILITIIMFHMWLHNVTYASGICWLMMLMSLDLSTAHEPLLEDFGPVRDT